MRRVSINGITEGMQLAKPIWGGSGELLLAAGVALTDGHLRLLHQRGCFVIYVQDGLTDDIDRKSVV